MVRWFCIVTASFLLVGSFACVGLCSGGENIDIRAKVMIGRITDKDGPDQPMEMAGTVSSARKSVARAMLLSAVLPGLGQIYAGGRRGYIAGGVMAAADVVSLWGYFANNGKGDDKKSEYEAWARDHYSRQDFESYVQDTIVVFSGYDDFGFCTDPSIQDSVLCWQAIHTVFPLAEDGSGAFYEQIDADDRYVFGWDDWSTEGIEHPEDYWVDWDPYSALPAEIPHTSANRVRYQNVRDDADDFYGKADRFAWVMVIGRVVSMIDAAIMVKLRNRDIAGIGTNPRLTFKAKLGSKPNMKVGLKLRF
jgi:hypothetical protein